MSLGGNLHLPLHDLVVGTYCNSWEVNVPDRICGALDGGDCGVANPLVINRIDQDATQCQASQT